MTTMVSKQRLTFKSDKSTTYLDNATPIVRIQRCVAILIQKKYDVLSLNVSAQLNYSHGYFTNYVLILGKPQPWLF